MNDKSNARVRRGKLKVKVPRKKVAPPASDQEPLNLKLGRKKMEKWDRRFCELAKFVSQWSKDPAAKVGAVVFCRRGGDISIGYNGFPMGVEDSAERLQNKDIKLDMIVHAEQNALLAAGARSAGSTICVWGKPICARCAGLIIQAGVKRVVALRPDVDPTSKWYETGKRAHQMLKEAEVELAFYTAGDSDTKA